MTDKQREYDRKYRARNREKLNRRARERRAADPEKYREAQRRRDAKRRKPDSFESRVCAMCEEQFEANLRTTGGRRQRFCSTRCANWQRQINRSGRKRDYLAKRQCEGCGNPIDSGDRITKRFCSAKCCQRAYEARKKKTKIVWCAVCDKEFRPAGYALTCSRKCSRVLRYLAHLRRRYHVTPERVKQCRRCGKRFLKTANAKFCKVCKKQVVRLWEYQHLMKSPKATLGSFTKCKVCRKLPRMKGSPRCGVCAYQRARRRNRAWHERRRRQPGHSNFQIITEKEAEIFGMMGANIERNNND